ncbi:MAG: hypothetical protein HYV07_32300 [Deltaproteobacteria bacterium]|nr:hypothetical protein [Deltaproteobacteria bacterium]
MKKYSPDALERLQNVLTTAFWYKQDLRSFLLRAGVPADVVNHYDWAHDYKRGIVSKIIDRLASASGEGTRVIGKLVDACLALDEHTFDRLRKLEDGERRSADAFAATARLRELFSAETVVARAEPATSADVLSAH